jgi:hypothetical protein
MQSHLDNAKDQLRQYYQDNYLAKSASVAPQPAVVETFSGSPQKVNFTARYKKRPNTLKDEIDEYYRLPLEDFDTCDPIQWWAGRHSQFPNLSCLARDILAIPGKLIWFTIVCVCTNPPSALQVQPLLLNEFFRAVAIPYPFVVLVSNPTPLGL